MTNSKHVESYFIKHHENGIVSVLFNTDIKWISYHRYDNQHYRIGEDYEEDEGCIQIVKLDIFLDENIRYVVTSQQDDDQICFYYIPADMLWNKREIVFSSGKLK